MFNVLQNDFETVKLSPTLKIQQCCYSIVSHLSSSDTSHQTQMIQLSHKRVKRRKDVRMTAYNYDSASFQFLVLGLGITELSSTQPRALVTWSPAMQPKIFNFIKFMNLDMTLMLLPDFEHWHWLASFTELVFIISQR